MLYVTHRNSIETFQIDDEIGGKKDEKSHNFFVVIVPKCMENCECVNSDDFIRWRNKNQNQIRE